MSEEAPPASSEGREWMDASQEEWEKKPGSGSDLRGQTDWGNISVRGQLALSGQWAVGTGHWALQRAHVIPKGKMGE
jgi:hypothetical protein